MHSIDLFRDLNARMPRDNSFTEIFSRFQLKMSVGQRGKDRLGDAALQNTYVEHQGALRIDCSKYIRQRLLFIQKLNLACDLALRL